MSSWKKWTMMALVLVICGYGTFACNSAAPMTFNDSKYEITIPSILGLACTWVKLDPNKKIVDSDCKCFAFRGLPPKKYETNASCHVKKWDAKKKKVIYSCSCDFEQDWNPPAEPSTEPMMDSQMDGGMSDMHHDGGMMDKDPDAMPDMMMDQAPDMMSEPKPEPRPEPMPEPRPEPMMDTMPDGGMSDMSPDMMMDQAPDMTMDAMPDMPSCPQGYSWSMDAKMCIKDDFWNYKPKEGEGWLFYWHNGPKKGMVMWRTLVPNSTMACKGVNLKPSDIMWQARCFDKTWNCMQIPNGTSFMMPKMGTVNGVTFYYVELFTGTEEVELLHKMANGSYLWPKCHHGDAKYVFWMMSSNAALNPLDPWWAHPSNMTPAP